MKFQSEIIKLGEIKFPEFSGTRVMMMPVHLHQIDTMLPNYREFFKNLLSFSKIKEGTAYITIDEAELKKGEYHRRPGLHVDGIGEDGKAAAYGGNGGGYASNGMLLVSNIIGCKGWNQTFEGEMKPNGNCSHLVHQLLPHTEVIMEPNTVYWCNPLAVHMVLQMPADVKRQFVRLSMPSSAPWHEGYTPNPYGIKPTGPIHGPRDEMKYRK